MCKKKLGPWGMSSKKLMCCAADVLEGRGTVQVAITVSELTRRAPLAPSHRGFASPALVHPHLAT